MELGKAAGHGLGKAVENDKKMAVIISRTMKGGRGEEIREGRLRRSRGVGARKRRG